MLDKVIEVNFEDFDAVVGDSKIPVLIDVWAPWCGPCKQMSPIIDKIAVDFAGKIKVVKINADNNDELVTQLRVRSLPTLMIMDGTRVRATKVGYISEAKLIDFINTNT